MDMCTPVQPVKVCAKLSSSKSSLGKLVDLHDAHKSSELDDTKLNIESQIGRGSCKVLSFKISSVCNGSNKSGLEVESWSHA